MSFSSLHAKYQTFFLSFLGALFASALFVANFTQADWECCYVDQDLSLEVGGLLVEGPIGVYNFFTTFPPPVVVEGSTMSAPSQAITINFLDRINPNTEQIQTVFDVSVPASRGVYLLHYYTPDPTPEDGPGGDILIPGTFSLVHAPIPANDGDPSTIESTTIMFDLPAFGDPSALSGTYYLSVVEYPEFKHVYDPITGDYVEEPYSDTDFLNYYEWQFVDFDAYFGEYPEYADYFPNNEASFIIDQYVATTGQHTPPTLSFSQDAGYAADNSGEGIEPNKGTANDTEMVFKAIYTGANAPDEMNVEIGGAGTTTLAMVLDTAAASSTLKDGDFTNGEQFVATSTFPKGKYQYHFEATAGTDTVRLPEADTLSFETGYSNVAFLPGHQASKLYRQQIFENQLWLPNLFGSDVPDLYHDTDGNSIRGDVYTRDVISSALTYDVYGDFLDFLSSLKADSVINDWKALPYDWRLDYDDILASGALIGSDNISYLVATSSPYIIQEIERLAETSANGKVTIVAHSNGGLLAKYLVKKLNDENNPLVDTIDKLVLVAVPQLGTPKAIFSMLHGDESPLPIIISQEETREFSENMPSAYHLLPSEMYFTATSGPVAIFSETDEDNAIAKVARGFYGDYDMDPELNYLRSVYTDYKIDSFSEFSQFIAGENGARAEPAIDDFDNPNVLKQPLLSQAGSIHSQLDTMQMPEELEVIQIAGWGLPTIQGIKYSRSESYECEFFIPCKPIFGIGREPDITTAGDKTVVLESAASLNIDTYFIDLNEYNSFFLNRNHASIMGALPVRTIISNVLQNLPTDEISYASTTPPTGAHIKIIETHSPVTLEVYDSSGRHTGPAPNPDPNSNFPYVEEQIPNSSYFKIGESTYIALGVDDTHRVVITGYDTGTFTLKVKELVDDIETDSVTYKNIPVLPGLRAEFNTQTVSDISEVNIDIDGDGAFDALLDEDTEETALSSLHIFSGMIVGMEIDKKFKKKLLKYVEKVEKELKKGKIRKVVKTLEKMIDELEGEIEDNLEREYEESEKKKYIKHGEEKHHRDEDDEGEENNDEKEEVKISTQDALMLINVVREIIRVVI